MATIGTLLHSWLHGEFVGEDAYGNRYYQHKRTPKEGRRSRWVIYKGMAEPSKVPPHWHGWLHYSTDEVPTEQKARTYVWQKEPIPNLTGTGKAYVPSGHITRGGDRAAATADYQAWKP